jgi:hypothetical protein
MVTADDLGPTLSPLVAIAIVGHRHDVDTDASFILPIAVWTVTLLA